MADLNKIIDELSTLTVVEAAELSKQLKKMETAAAPVAAAPAEERQHLREKNSIFNFLSFSRR